MDTGYPYASFSLRLLANPCPCGLCGLGCGPSSVGWSLSSLLSRGSPRGCVSTPWMPVFYVWVASIPIPSSGSLDPSSFSLPFSSCLLGSPMTVARLGCDRTPDHKSKKVPLITVLSLILYLFTVATPFYPPTEKVLSDANDLSAAEY